MQGHLRRAVRMSIAAVASSPDVGSSMNSREGWATSSSPMFTRFLWPPLHHQRILSPPVASRRRCRCKISLLPQSSQAGYQSAQVIFPRLSKCISWKVSPLTSKQLLFVPCFRNLSHFRSEKNAGFQFFGGYNHQFSVPSGIFPVCFNVISLWHYGGREP